MLKVLAMLACVTRMPVATQSVLCLGRSRATVWAARCSLGIAHTILLRELHGVDPQERATVKIK